MGESLITRSGLLEAGQQAFAALGMFAVGLGIGAAMVANRLARQTCGGGSRFAVDVQNCSGQIAGIAAPIADTAAGVGLLLLFTAGGSRVYEVYTDD